VETTASCVSTVTSSSPWRSVSRRTTLDPFEVGAAPHLDHDAEQGPAVEHPHGRRHGDDGRLVDVRPELDPAGGEHADHPHPPAADAHHLANHLLTREQLAGHLGAQHHDRPAAPQLLGGDELAPGER
jgi:hypothetical protein